MTNRSIKGAFVNSPVGVKQHGRTVNKHLPLRCVAIFKEIFFKRCLSSSFQHRRCSSSRDSLKGIHWILSGPLHPFHSSRTFCSEAHKSIQPNHIQHNSFFALKLFRRQLQMFQKVESGGGPFFKDIWKIFFSDFRSVFPI